MRISCTGAKCAVTEVEYMASGAINYFTASFTFDNAWTEFTSANKVYGVFAGSDSVILTTLVYNSETQTYDCDVPWETIKYQGELLVGAIGHITTPETKILTTNMAFGYKIPEGAATNATTGSQPSGLLLDILEAAEQVSDDADRAQTNADRAEANADRAEAAVNHFPYIDPTTNNWFKWDVATGVFVDTGVDAKGEDGIGITSIVKTDTVGLVDTYTITFSNATTTTFTVTNGEKGDTGDDFVVLGHYDTLSALQAAVPSPNVGDGYSIGTETPYNIYIYDGATNNWIDYGKIQGPKGDTGAKGEATYWYTGTAITGTSTSDTIFSDSGITLANIKDLYLNTETGNIYKCTLGGSPFVATWIYIGNIRGAAGTVASIDIVRW